MAGSKRLVWFLVLVVVALIGSASWATAADEPWLILLKEQLVTEKKCFFEHIVNIRTFELAGAEVIDGRVRCMDGREYYFTRPKPHLAFELRECEPALC
ncbi:MAG: hypothetical protein R3D57_02450 [Hyphomicrobiaceae bacterium]